MLIVRMNDSVMGWASSMVKFNASRSLAAPCIEQVIAQSLNNRLCISSIPIEQVIATQSQYDAQL